MRRSITLALSLFGLFDSLYLLYTYTSPSRPMVCLGTGCDAVRASAYSSIGGVPVPVFGVIGYTLLAIILVGEALASGRPAKLARYAFLGMTGFGVLVSLYLEYLQAFVIHAYCAWCLASGALMVVLFALAVLNAFRSGPEPEAAARLAGVRNLFAVSVAAVLAGVPAFYALARHGEAAPAAPAPAAADLTARLTRPGNHEAGNPEAPLTVVEFGDFECPVCARGEAAAREIRARYGGRVRFVFRQFPLERIHPFARNAAVASECAAEQGKFWEMLETIYARQSDLSTEGLRRNAAGLGLNQAAFDRCLSSGAATERVLRDVEDGRALGVRATPTFFIGPQKVEGVMAEEQFAALVEAHLAGAAVEAAGSPRDTGTAAGRSGVTKSAAGPGKAAAERTAVAAKPAGKPPGRNAAGGERASAKPAQAPAALSGASLGGFVPALQPAAPGGLLGAPSAGAGCSEADAAKQQPTMIGTGELRQLLAGAAPLFVDVRPAGEYAAGRIPGATNIPVDEMERRWNALPKNRILVLYEGGGVPGDICAAGRAAGRKLLEHGFPFSQVKVYQDGLAGWQRAEPPLATPGETGRR